jgi:hypothetical protein
MSTINAEEAERIRQLMADWDLKKRLQGLTEALALDERGRQ